MSALFCVHEFISCFLTSVSLIADTPVETIKSTNSKYRMKKVRMNLVADVGEELERLADWIDLLRSDHR